MSEESPRIPASWVLYENVKATVLDVSEGRTDLLIERLYGPGAAVLSITADGRMLTNNVDIDVSDDFPAYLGLFDQFAEMGENVKIGDSVIMDHENLVYEDSESYMGMLYQIGVLARRMAAFFCPEETVPVIKETLDRVIDHDCAENMSPIPFQGSLSEALVAMIKEMLVVMAAHMTQEGDWDDTALSRLMINPDNTWALPGTFHTERGTWQVTEQGVTVSFSTED